MKARILLGVVMATVATLAWAMKNEPNGFRNLSWGTEQSTVASEMTLDEDGDRTKFYTRKGDKMQIGGAELSSIAYGFTGGRLHHVFIKTQGVANRVAIVDAFTAQFGSPYKPNRYMNTYYWNGSVTRIIISCNSIRDECSVILSSTEIDKQEEAAKKAAAENAASDF